MSQQRVVLVHRATEYDELLARHATRGQAAYFLGSRGHDMVAIEERHQSLQEVLAAVSRQIPLDWRRGVVERADLSSYLFTPDDIVVVVGQDGLVANVAKYLSGQPVIGVDPGAGSDAGVLSRHPPTEIVELLQAAASDSGIGESRTMVQLEVDDGQQLVALNEVYLGHRTHQTSRYTLRALGMIERQASSGIVVGTGTGSTGWCRSLSLERHSTMVLPRPEDRALAWFVREAWPSPWSRIELTEGGLGDGNELLLEVESDRLVAFGDGIEDDRLVVTRGQTVRVAVARRHLRLV